jgi:hypothetical protein
MTDTPHQANEAFDLSHRLQADSVGRTLSLVGERWTIMILRETFFGVRRYSQFARNLAIPRPTLSLRLRKLFPAVIALMRWGDTHLAGPEGPPIVLRHETCGQRTHPHVTCDACGEEISTRNVRPERGPGFIGEPAPASKRARRRGVREA